MKRAIGLFGLFSMLTLAVGCTTTPIKGKPFGSGSVFSEVQFNEHTNDAPFGDKQGEACATSILNIMATGDASAATAAKKAGITRISTIDGSNNTILGIMSKYCVLVTGE